MRTYGPKPELVERQRTLDAEILVESKRFINDAVKADNPFFVWHNATHMHYRTNLSSKYEGKSGYGLYADGMNAKTCCGRVPLADGGSRP